MKGFVFGFGEYLPFRDGTFDIISTYQTLWGMFNRLISASVSVNLSAYLGGVCLFIQSPDSISFFEGDYRIPMLPIMNKFLFKNKDKF